MNNNFYNFEAWEKITTEGVLDGITLEFNRLPLAYSISENLYKGSVQKLHYSTDAYENGITYDKFATVYLPYGYNPMDKEKKYNVLYYLHGDGSSPNEQFVHKKSYANGWNILDNMMYGEHAITDPFIVICPTYYFEYDENSPVTKPKRGPSGDGLYKEIKGNFYKEVIQDLIPKVESQFNVYCEDFSEKGIKASREHRAFCGYSRGSAYTWHMFHYNLDYFKWWLPMSANCLKEGMTPDDIPWSDEEAFAYIKEAIDSNPELPFFIMASSGGIKDFPVMRKQMNYFFKQKNYFSYGKDPSVNNFYYTCADYPHSGFYFAYYLANVADILFKN